jgi:hypothetical protein
MNKQEFVSTELGRFEEKHSPERPFRVAVSSNFNGGDYAYGSHTDCREYGDTTMGWADDQATAEILLGEAWEEQERRNAAEEEA